MNNFALVFVVMTLRNYANSQFFVTDSNVKISVNPPYIVEGLVSKVDIICTFKKDNVPSMASVLSMTLGHSNQSDRPVFEYLATANEWDSHAHNVSHDVEVISGSIDNNGESQLHMRFMYPETHLIGLYMCEVTGLDQIGKPVSIYSTLNVITTNVTALFDVLYDAQSNITDLENALHSAQSNITELVDAVRNVQSNITDLREALENVQSNISAVQACQEAYTEVVDRVQLPMYSGPILYNGHMYYLSRVFKYFYRVEMQTQCEALGGYLIELDSHDEFTFIRDYLIKQINVRLVYAGATNNAKPQGVWINEHNVTSSPTFDWAQGIPLYLYSTRNCQCFDYFQNFFLTDCYCYDNKVQYSQYMCEIPKNEMC